jgi:hypothetical protein
MLKPHDLVVEISQLHHEGRQRRARFNGPTISTSQLVRFDVSPRNPFADFLVVDAVLRNRSPKCFFLGNREFIANEAKNRAC